MKRIEFLTQDDPLYILPLFAEFFRSYAEDFTITRVSCCPTMGVRPRGKLIKELALLYGPLGFARLAARRLLARSMSVYPAGRSARRYWSLQQLCRAYGVCCENIGNPNDAGFVEGVRERDPDLIVSVACPYILKKPLLNLTRFGVINIHHAPLPRYKGMMPTFWQMFHGEREVGVTVHSMAEKVDEGSILLQERLPIEPGESLDHLIRRSKQHGAHCLARVIRNIDSMPAGAVAATAERSYFTFPTPQEIREFHRKGLRAI